MADYYSILKKTISGLPNNNQETRDAVYAKARSAIERQLRAMDPAPSDEVFSRQMASLEEAFVKLDAEFGAAVQAEVPPQTEEDIIAEAIASGENAQPSIADATSPQAKPETIKTPEPTTSTSSGPEVASDIPSVENYKEPQIADPQGMEYSETILADTPETGAPVGTPAKVKKRGCLSNLLPILLAIGVIAGGLYALWINKDALMKGLSGGDTKPAIDAPAKKPVKPEPAKQESNAEQPLKPAPKVRVVGEDAAPKSSSQLTADGVTLEAAPIETPAAPVDVAPVENVPTQPSAESTLPPVADDGLPPIVEPEPIVQPEVTAPEAQTEPQAELPPIATTEPEVVTPETAPVAEAVTPQAVQPSGSAPAVAQKAFLYEEGSSGSNASRDNAAIIWSLARDLNGEAVINGKLDVPGRNLSMNIAIKRNSDASLPASHIIELTFQLPGDFSGGNISNVVRFVMKSSEQARGEGLIAVPAKISDGNFLIALNNLDQAVTTNRKLLLESSWIDVPLGYTTGRRALVTLEKGAIGDKVFRDAFADWDTR